MALSLRHVRFAF